MNSWQTNFYNTKVKPYKKYEREASERIKKLCNVEIFDLFNKNNGNKYDFKDSNEIKYEVKYDGYSIKSGNFYIEYKGYGKASGITTTEANFYVITDGTNYYLIDVEILKKLCCQYGIIRCTKDGLTFGNIINCDVIINNCQTI